MKRQVRWFLLLVVIIATGCSNSSSKENSTKAAQPSPDVVGQEAAVRSVIESNARALTDFPTNRDIKSVMDFYSPDYTAVEDGEYQDREATEKILAQLKTDYDLGNPVRPSLTVSDIKVQVMDTLAVATYKYSLKIGMVGQVLEQHEGFYTTILKKEAGKWLIARDHSSVIKPAKKARK